MDETYRIPEFALEKLQQQIQRLSRRAEKLGASPVALTVLDGYQDVEDETGIVTRLYRVRVTGEAPRLDGWRFVAQLQHGANGNVVRAVPGEGVPRRFRTAEPWCEHCNLQRNRKATYVVAKGDLYRQVGSACLADFTGHPDPHTAAAAAEGLIEAAELCENAADLDGVRVRGHYRFQIEAYLAHVAAEVRRDGWTPRSADCGLPTADAAFATMLHGSQGLPDYVPPLPSDWETARQALVWVRDDLATCDRLNDYEWNLVRSCESDPIAYEQIGLVASAIAAHERALNRRAERATSVESRHSQHVGVVGQRQRFDDLTVTGIITLDGRWGATRLHKFVDADGNRLVWFASNAKLARGKCYSGRATVKAHDVYREVPETVLIRCTFSMQSRLETEGD